MLVKDISISGEMLEKLGKGSGHARPKERVLNTWCRLGGGRYWTQLLKSRRGMMLSGTLRRSCWNYIRSFLHGLDGFSHY